MLAGGGVCLGGVFGVASRGIKFVVMLFPSFVA